MAIRVLAVDDEPDVLRLIALKLQKAGFEVLTARDGEDGLSAASAYAPDVVLMDMMMPRMDGLTAAERIKAELRPAPIVIMLTAKGEWSGGWHARMTTSSSRSGRANSWPGSRWP